MPNTYDDPQPTGPSRVHSLEEYEAGERARVAKSRAQEAEANARIHRAVQSVNKEREQVTSSTSKFLNRTILKVPRKALLTEFVVALILVTGSSLAAGNTPKPSQYVAVWVVYLALSIMADLSPSSARFAAGLGGLVLLVIALNRSGDIITVLNTISGTGKEGV